MDRDLLLTGLQEVAELINRTEWTDEQRSAFNGMRQVVFFQGKVDVNGYVLERPWLRREGSNLLLGGRGISRKPGPRRTSEHLLSRLLARRAVQEGRLTPRLSSGWVGKSMRSSARSKVARRLNCRPEDIAYLQAFEDSQPKIEGAFSRRVSRKMHHA